MARWNLSVEDTTDQNLRAFLGQIGAKKGGMSKFVEEAVLEKVFSEAIKFVKDRNSDADQSEITATIDKALKDIRTGRS